MTMIELARKLRPYIEQAASSLSDADALEARQLFPKWREGAAYAAGDRVQYGDILYKVLQAHASQADWTPDTAPSLYAKVLIPDPTVVPDWEQPDSTNTYSLGDTVNHNGKTWVSDYNHNSWEPGVFGWREVANG